MTSSGQPGRPRVSPVLLPERYSPPQPPPASASTVRLDTFRQTTFLLGAELRLFKAGMECQLQLQHDSYPSRHRSHALAALTVFWSRAYSALRDSAELLMSGSYPSIPPLIRSATECIGAQAQLHEEEMDVYESWLDNSLTQVHTLRALDLNLGRYRAAGILASDPELGAIYRFVSDLSGTAFGGSFFLTAADSNQQRVLVGFADETFHAGYAELTLGWLLRLCERQLAFTEQASNVFQVTGERSREIGKLRAEIGSVLGRSSRCRVEEQTIDGERRYLVVNFRRAPSGAARRIVL